MGSSSGVPCVAATVASGVCERFSVGAFAFESAVEGAVLREVKR